MNFETISSGSRPLKCKMCPRRFKYVACMKDHIKTDHKNELVRWLNQRHVEMRGVLLAAMAKNAENTKAVRVSVIKPNINVSGAGRDLME